jgi:alpha/beta superfamily hydrolase
LELDTETLDALARGREVSLVDYRGVGSSSGEFGPAIADTPKELLTPARAY